MSRRAPIVLANADFYGTLAATRALGRAGIPVTIADGRVLTVSRWSRYATRTVRCPTLTAPRAFLDWLTAFGEEEPGRVLYPTSDEAAFLYALRLPELSRTFLTYQPDIDVILGVLDKKRLYEAARQVGLDVPDTWFPEAEADVERVAREAPMPLLVKPRTQVLSRTHSKGVVVERASELPARYRAYREASPYDPLVVDLLPQAPMPMLQRFLPQAAERIHVVAAFLDRSGKHFAARAATKVFQRPRTLGIGLCFVDSPLDPGLADAARRLALACGYYGLFQLELIEAGGRHLLIDFNPRFYNQMAYDMARGFPAAGLVYAAATRDDGEVERLAREAADARPRGDAMVFCHRSGLRMMIALQRLAGVMSESEASRWRQWEASHAPAAIDPVHAAGDRLPGIVDLAAQVAAYARHPRAFLRQVVLDRTS